MTSEESCYTWCTLFKVRTLKENQISIIIYNIISYTFERYNIIVIVTKVFKL